MRLSEAHAESDFKTLASGLKLDLGKKRTFKLKHRHPGNAATVEATVPGFSLLYDIKTKDLLLEHKREVKLGSLTIKQRLPHKQLYLFPSPEVKLHMKSKAFHHKHKVKSETSISYDFQKSVGKVEQEVSLRGKYKATVTADTLTGTQGATLALKAELPSKRLTSVGLHLSRAAGPVVKAEAKMLSGKKAVKAKVDYKVRTKDTKVELEPPSIDKKLKLTATSVFRVGDSAKKPSFLLGAKLDF